MKNSIWKLRAGSRNFWIKYSSIFYLPTFLNYEDGVFSTGALENDKTIVPTQEKWMKFWEKLERIGVWDWAEHYTPDFMYLDVVSLYLRIQLGYKKIECSGSNAYPDKDGEMDEIKFTFRRLLLAINKLTGKKTVGINIE